MTFWPSDDFDVEEDEPYFTTRGPKPPSPSTRQRQAESAELRDFMGSFPSFSQPAGTAPTGASTSGDVFVAPGAPAPATQEAPAPPRLPFRRTTVADLPAEPYADPYASGATSGLGTPPNATAPVVGGPPRLPFRAPIPNVPRGLTDTSTLPGLARANLRAGVGDVLSGAGFLEERAVAPLGMKGMFAEETGAPGLQAEGVQYDTPDKPIWEKLVDPKFWASSAARSAPGMAAGMAIAAPVGMTTAGIAAGAGIGSFGAGIIGALSGGVASRPMESAMEASGVRDEARQRGLSPAEANAAADQVFWSNMLLAGSDFMQLGATFLPVPNALRGAIGRLGRAGRVGTVLGRGALDAILEGAEEGVQEEIGSSAMDRRAFDLWKALTDPEYREAREAGVLMGAVGGAVLGGGRELYDAFGQEVVSNAPDGAKLAYEQGRRAAEIAGKTPAEAHQMGLDVMAARPEGQQAIQQTVLSLRERIVSVLEEGSARLPGAGEADMAAVREALGGPAMGGAFSIQDVARRSKLPNHRALAALQALQQAGETEATSYGWRLFASAQPPAAPMEVPVGETQEGTQGQGRQEGVPPAEPVAGSPRPVYSTGDVLRWPHADAPGGVVRAQVLSPAIEGRSYHLRRVDNGVEFTVSPRELEMMGATQALSGPNRAAARPTPQVTTPPEGATGYVLPGFASTPGRRTAPATATNEGPTTTNAPSTTTEAPAAIYSQGDLVTTPFAPERPMRVAAVEGGMLRLEGPNGEMFRRPPNMVMPYQAPAEAAAQPALPQVEAAAPARTPQQARALASLPRLMPRWSQATVENRLAQAIEEGDTEKAGIYQAELDRRAGEAQNRGTDATEQGSLPASAAAQPAVAPGASRPGEEPLGGQPAGDVRPVGEGERAGGSGAARGDTDAGTRAGADPEGRARPGDGLGRGDQGDTPEPVREQPGLDTAPPPNTPPAPQANTAKRGRDYVSTPTNERTLADRSPTEVIEDNLAALAALRDILRSKKRTPTREQQAALSRYTGWGDSRLGGIFPRSLGEQQIGLGRRLLYGENGRRRSRLEDLVTDIAEALVNEPGTPSAEAMLTSIAESRLNAFYTTPGIVRAMWGALDRMGLGKLTAIRALEPSAGNGRFLSMMPAGMVNRAQRAAVELDTITGHVLRGLFPDTDVRIMGFQDADFLDDTFDIVISNVPFGSFGVTDRRRDRKGKRWYPDEITGRIHNYFFAKALDKVRPGGVVAFVTSHGTMDSPNSRPLREWLSHRAELVGAIRLPEGAFPDTRVVTDIIFLQKRAAVDTSIVAPWVDVATVQDPEALRRMQRDYRYSDAQAEQKSHYTINRHFIDNKWAAVGAHRVSEHGMYERDSYTLAMPEGVTDIEDRLKAALRRLPAGIIQPPAAGTRAADQTVSLSTDEAAKGKSVGTILLQDGKLMRVALDDKSQPVLEPFAFTVQSKDSPNYGKKLPPGKRDEQRIRKMLEIRDLATEILRRDLAGEALTAERQALGQRHIAFVSEYGPLNSLYNRRMFGGDPDLYLLRSLEKYDPTYKKAKQEEADAAKQAKVKWTTALIKGIQTDIFRQSTQRRQEIPERVGDSKDALLVSLNELGKLDFARMAQLTGRTEDEVIADLHRQSLIYRNPDGGWEHADEYLTGYVKPKLARAREAAEREPDVYSANVAALEAVQPADVPASEITVNFGAHWVPAEDYQNFINATLGAEPLEDGTGGARVTRAPITGTWGIAAGYLRNAVQTRLDTDFGTGRMGAIAVATHVMNNSQIRVVDTFTEGGKRVERINENETAAAEIRAERWRKAFADWIWQDSERSARLGTYYNEHFNNFRKPRHDGSHLTLAGSNPRIKLRSGQKDSIWRIITEGDTGLYHEVGFGKTWTMQGAGMELRRLGISKKNVYVVPNHLVGQFAQDFHKLYPGAKILVPEQNDFDAGNRRTLMARMATSDWDAIIMAQSQFTMISVKPETQEAWLNREIAQITDAMSGDWGSDKQLRGRLRSAQERLKKVQDEMAAKGREGALYWEDLGVGALFVDEADMYKNLPVYTGMGNVRGLPSSRAERAVDMDMKIAALRAANGRITFATGTPVSNTIAELWVMMHYLQPEALAQMGVDRFDAWANMFGQVRQSIEQTTTGAWRPVKRFIKFVNVPELAKLFQITADVRMAEDAPELARRNPRLVDLSGKPSHRITVTSPASDDLRDYMAQLVEREKAVKARKGPPQKGDDNILAIANDARLAALDVRFRVAGAADDPNSKLNTAARQVVEVHRKYEADRATQLVFINLGTPKAMNDDEMARLEKIREEEGEEAAVEYLAKLGQDAGDEALLDDVYGDLRRKLVAQGIPAKEIAFIHQAKTREQRIRLFDQVNNGEVRVLLGSTDKMGAGTNVQKRLVALHFLTPEWRPRDRQQGEGRAMRQGNEVFGPTVDAEDRVVDIGRGIHIFQYATEESYDGLMLQTLRTKLAAIRTIMRREVTARETEDVDDLTAAFAVGQTRTIGNPLVVERFAIQSRVQQLERDEAAYLNARYTMSVDLAGYRRDVPTQQAKLPALDEDARLAAAGTDKLELTFGDTTITDRKQENVALFANHLTEQIRVIQAAGAWNEPRHVATFNGFAVWLSYSPYRGGAISTEIRGREGHRMDTILQEHFTARGLVQRLDNRIKEIASVAAVQRAYIARLEQKIADLEERLEVGWPGAEELSGWRRLYTAIENVLSPPENATEEQLAEISRELGEAREAVPEDTRQNEPTIERDPMEAVMADYQARLLQAPDLDELNAAGRTARGDRALDRTQKELVRSWEIIRRNELDPPYNPAPDLSYSAPEPQEQPLAVPDRAPAPEPEAEPEAPTGTPEEIAAQLADEGIEATPEDIAALAEVEPETTPEEAAEDPASVAGEQPPSAPPPTPRRRSGGTTAPGPAAPSPNPQTVPPPPVEAPPAAPPLPPDQAPTPEATPGETPQTPADVSPSTPPSLPYRRPRQQRPPAGEPPSPPADDLAPSVPPETPSTTPSPVEPPPLPVPPASPQTPPTPAPGGTPPPSEPSTPPPAELPTPPAPPTPPSPPPASPPGGGPSPAAPPPVPPTPPAPPIPPGPPSPPLPPSPSGPNVPPPGPDALRDARQIHMAIEYGWEPEAPSSEIEALAQRWDEKAKRMLLDTGATLRSVQNTIYRDFQRTHGRRPTPDENAYLLYRLFPGHGDAAALVTRENLLPHLNDLDEMDIPWLETALQMHDDLDVARSIEARVTSSNLERPIGPVQGEAALERAGHRFRGRITKLGYLQAQAEEAANALAQVEREYQNARSAARGAKGGPNAEQLAVERDAARARFFAARRRAREVERTAEKGQQAVAGASDRIQRIGQQVERRRIAAEGRLAEEASLRGAEAAAERNFSEGVTYHSEENIWTAIGTDISEDRLRRVRAAAEGIWRDVSPLMRRTLLNAEGITQEVFDEWEARYPHYIPTRVMEYLHNQDYAGGRGRILSSVADLGVEELTIRGTDATRRRPLAALIEALFHTEELAHRIRIGNAMIAMRNESDELREVMPRLIGDDEIRERADDNGIPNGGPIRVILQRASEQGVELLSADERLAADGLRPNEGYFYRWTGGQREAYAAPKGILPLFIQSEPLVRGAMWVARGIGTVGGTRVLRNVAVTYNPAYYPLEFIRGTWSYLMAHPAREIPAEVGQLARAYADMIRSKRGQDVPDLNDAIRSGMGGSAGFVGQTPEQLMGRFIREAIGDRGPAAFRVARNAADFLYQVRDVIGTAPKLAEYRYRLERGAAPEEAALAGREMNVDADAAGWLARVVNQIIPFFNIGVQGLTQRYRQFRANPAQFGLMTMSGIVIPALIAELWNRWLDEEEYERTPAYLRDGGIVLMLPFPDPAQRDGKNVRAKLYLPMPQELAFLKTGFNELAMRAGGESPRSLAQVLFSMLRSSTPVSSVTDPLPPFLETAFALKANYDPFRESEVVPEYIQGRSISEQYKEDTSALGRMLGKATNKPPAAWDFLLSNALVAPGRAAMSASNTIARATGQSAPEVRSDPVGQVPVVGAMARSIFRNPNAASRTDESARLAYRGGSDQAAQEAIDNIRRQPGFMQLPAAQRYAEETSAAESARRQVPAPVGFRPDATGGVRKFPAGGPQDDAPSPRRDAIIDQAVRQVRAWENGTGPRPDDQTLAIGRYYEGRESLAWERAQEETAERRTTAVQGTLPFRRQPAATPTPAVRLPARSTRTPVGSGSGSGLPFRAPG